METPQKLEYLRSKMLSEIEEYAFILLDPTGHVLTWNKGAERLKGYSANEIIGQSYCVFYLPSDRQAGLPDMLLQHARTEGSANHIGKRLRKDGRINWEHVNLTALRENDDVIGFALVTREDTGTRHL